MQLRKFTDQKDEAQRVQAELNSRPELTEAERALSLYFAMEIARQAGHMELARDYARALRPIAHLLPERF